MLALKRVVTVAVMVYLLLALLFLLFPAVRTSLAELGSGTSPAENERNFFYVLSCIGVLVLAAQLITENIDSSALRRTVSKHESKINELKAKLYDTHQHTTPTPLAESSSFGPAVVYPTAAEAAATERTPLRPDGPPAPPTTL